MQELGALQTRQPSRSLTVQLALLQPWHPDRCCSRTTGRKVWLSATRQHLLTDTWTTTVGRQALHQVTPGPWLEVRFSAQLYGGSGRGGGLGRRCS